jgi:hypothetical protein
MIGFLVLVEKGGAFLAPVQRPGRVVESVLLALRPARPERHPFELPLGDRPRIALKFLGDHFLNVVRPLARADKIDATMLLGHVEELAELREPFFARDDLARRFFDARLRLELGSQDRIDGLVAGGAWGVEQDLIHLREKMSPCFEFCLRLTRACLGKCLTFSVKSGAKRIS